MQQIVLLVEDDSIVRKFVTAALEQESFIVLPASNAAEALEISFERIKIDLVFADVQLGGDINGIELAERIRRDKTETKVLVMSGLPDSEAEAADKSLPFLRKPFSHADLTGRVQEALSGTKQPISARSLPTG